MRITVKELIEKLTYLVKDNLEAEVFVKSLQDPSSKKKPLRGVSSEFPNEVVIFIP